MSFERRVFRKAVVLGASISVLGSLPPKMTGALSVQMSDDLDFSIAALGTTIAVLHGVGALAGIPLGRLADRLGSTRSIGFAAGVSALAFFAIAFLAFDWLTLMLGLTTGVVAGRLGSPASSRLLVRKIPPDRLGTAFGLKQTAGPMSGMVAGLSVPFVAVTVGWNWAFALVGCYALALMFFARRTSHRKPLAREVGSEQLALPHRRLLGVLAIAFGLQGAATTLLVVFFVPSAVASGVSAAAAGVFLAISSAGAMLVRILVGRLCDKMTSGHLRISALMLGVGSIGIALLALGNPVTTMVGITVGLGAAWGQPGVFWFSVVRFYSEAPGRVTGLLTPATNIGGVVGPFFFGLLAAGAGYAAAWLLCLILAFLASLAMLAANRRIVALESHPEMD